MQANSTNVANGLAVHLWPDTEEIMEQLEMWNCPKITLAKGNEICDVQDAIRLQVVELAAKEEKEPPLKLV